jgi:hypothetical protein
MLQTVCMVYESLTSSFPLTHQPGACCKPSVTVTVVFICTTNMNLKTKSNILYVNSRACKATPRPATRLIMRASVKVVAYISQAHALQRLYQPQGHITNLCILDCARHSPMATCLIHSFMRVCVQLDAYKRRDQVLQHLFAGIRSHSGCSKPSACPATQKSLHLPTGTC